MSRRVLDGAGRAWARDWLISLAWSVYALQTKAARANAQLARSDAN